MNSTGFITDQYSTLSGLAAVAYGDVDYFREVQNQLFKKSPFSTLNIFRPSSNLESFVGSRKSLEDVLIAGLKRAYDEDQDVEDFFDIEFGSDWENQLNREVIQSITRELDAYEVYEITYRDLIYKSLEDKIDNDEVIEVIYHFIDQEIKENPIGKDFNLLIRAVTNSPQNKISSPPPDSIIDLDNSVSLGKDYRGVDFDKGYLSPREYFANIPYPSFTNIFDITNSLIESIQQGLVGYPSFSPLETLINPSGAVQIDTSSGAKLSSLYDLVRQTDQDIYDISLIGERLNGYLSYNPGTSLGADSNGDFVDPSLLPNFAAQNNDSGVIPLARERDKAF